MTNTSQHNTNPKEKNETNFVGIDVATNELVVHVLPTNQQLVVPNSQDGIRELIKQLKTIKSKGQTQTGRP